MTTTPTPVRVTIKDRLEFQNGKLVKIDGMRPEYMDGYRLISLIRELALAAIQPDPEPQPVAWQQKHGDEWVVMADGWGPQDCADWPDHEFRPLYTTPSSAGDHEPIRIGTIGNYYGALNLKREGGQDYWAIEDWDDSCSWVEIPAQLAAALRALGGERE